MSDAEKRTVHFVDITSDVCPMTLVRAKLRIERLAPGEVLEIRLNRGEPLENVPRSLMELGHVIESLLPEDPALGNGVHRLRVRRH
ncbi:sulfurtransferase TusA family protein [Arenibaculum pallidiluteum]|uniref:sulfurtransferase TusA family protein n=1 Tax=Arenibaculum pallidiluteum TaxID=2812559 RepID=UPI002E2AD83A|nr:sulfurtransferase TusA family protein [Arenibaculum pallidiluteum]